MGNYKIKVTGGNPYQIKVKTAAQGPVGPQGPQGEQGIPGAGYTLPVANATTLGGVKVGDNLTINGDGVLSAGNSYVLPAATNSALGGIIVGDNLTITANGVLSGVNSYTLPVATNSILGGVIVGSGLNVSSGVISATYAGLPDTPNLSVYLTTSAAASTYQPLGNYTTPANLTWSNITGKPTFATVATTGSYNDLTNKPTLTGASWGSITGTLSSQTDLQAALDAKQVAGSYVLTSDSRLSDARTPLSHTQAWSTITSTPTTLSGYGITDAYSSSNPSGYITASALSPYLTTASASSTYTPQTRSIAAGTGISGGGDLSANRTLSLATSGVTAGTYGSGSIVPKITVDAYGRITSVISDTIYPDWNNISSKPANFAYTTANTFSGDQNLADNELIRPKLKDYSETVATPAVSGGTLTLNLETGNFFAVSLNADISTPITITNPPASGATGSFTLELTADGTPRTISWGSIKWPGGTPPTLTSAIGKRDLLVFYTRDGGANWYGLIGGQNL